MSSNDSKDTDKRPESVDDLGDYETSDTIVRLKITEPVLFGSGVVAALDSFVAALRAAYPDLISVEIKDLDVKVRRLYNEVEVAESLRNSQRYWDYRHPGEAPSTEAGA